MKRFSTFHTLLLLILLMGVSAITAFAQITPAADAYTDTASPDTNYGARALLDVGSPSQTTYIQFDLSSIPSGYTGSSIAKATLKLYVNAVTMAGSFNVDYVNGSWSEGTITANLGPALGTTIVPSVALAKNQTKDYLLIDITTAVQAWLNGTQANDGIALVANSPLNASFDSKESTTQSHPPELDIVFASGKRGGITGVLTGAGSGLTGGGTSGTLNLSLLTSCGNAQILAWNGTAWACGSAGTGTITGVTAGTDLTGGGTGGNVKLSLDTTRVPQLAGNNTFSGSQGFAGNVGVGIAPSSTGYTPLSISSPGSFGTWLAIGNSSTGHTWNLISAGSQNAEGAGNLGITDLTGKSRIWLEGSALVTGSLGVGTGTPAYQLEVDSGDALIRGATNFQGNNQSANLYLGDNLHPITATFGEGLSFGAYQVPQAMFIHDGDGHVSVGFRQGVSPNFQFYVQGVGSSNQGGAILGQSQLGNGMGVEGIGADGVTGDGGSGIEGIGGDAGVSGSDGVGGIFHGGGGSAGGDGIDAFAGSGVAGFFNGNVVVTGSLSKGGGSFKIDHPLDPANKYLYHSFVESPDMMDISNGNIVTDGTGDATIQLPEWFEALNRDFRYQLTVIGQFAQAIVTQKVSNHQFGIKTDKPEVEVSWQVTGIRQDAWANAHRIPIEEEKNERERGFYLHPELYGAPAERSVSWARHPETMKRITELHKEGDGATATGKSSSALSTPAAEHTR